MNEQNVPKRKSAWLKYGIIAGCVVLLLALGFGVYSITKTKGNDATASGTPITGTTETAQAIGATETTPATGSTTDTKLPEDNQSTEGTTEEDYVYTVPEWIGVHYRINVEFEKTTDGTHSELKESIVKKYDGETLLWQATIPEFFINQHQPVSDGVIVFGWKQQDHPNPNESWVAKVSDAGEVLWKYKLENEWNKYETIKAVVENADNSYAVFTTCNSHLCIHKFSADGQHILFEKNPVEDRTFGCVTQVGDGYWVQLGYIESHIVRLDKTGKITGTYDFEKENFNYNILNMVEYNGKVYMSANVTPKVAERDPARKDNLEEVDFYALLGDGKSLTYSEIDGITCADITDRYKNHYSAVLLECDVNTGAFREVCTVKESVGRKLAVNDAGVLAWEVCKIQRVLYTPQFSSSRGRLIYQMYRYGFDSTGKMIQQEETDIIAYNSI